MRCAVQSEIAPGIFRRRVVAAAIDILEFRALLVPSCPALSASAASGSGKWLLPHRPRPWRRVSNSPTLSRASSAPMTTPLVARVALPSCRISDNFTSHSVAGGVIAGHASMVSENWNIAHTATRPCVEHRRRISLASRSIQRRDTPGPSFALRDFTAKAMGFGGPSRRLGIGIVKLRSEVILRRWRCLGVVSSAESLDVQLT